MKIDSQLVEIFSVSTELTIYMISSNKSEKHFRLPVNGERVKTYAVFRFAGALRLLRCSLRFLLVLGTTLYFKVAESVLA